MPDFTPDEYDNVVFAEFRKTPVPIIGERVRLVLHNDSLMLMGPWAHLCPSTVRLVGNVIKMPRDLIVPEAFGLWTDENVVPLQIIRMHRLLSINGEHVRGYSAPSRGSLTTAKQRPSSFEVKGSKGDTYLLEYRNGRWACNCRGFSYRNTCSHADGAAKTHGT